MTTKCLEALRDGMAAIVATDTVYGLAALPGSTGYASIFELKKRPPIRFFPGSCMMSTCLMRSRTTFPPMPVVWPRCSGPARSPSCCMLRRPHMSWAVSRRTGRSHCAAPMMPGCLPFSTSSEVRSLARLPMCMASPRPHLLQMFPPRCEDCLVVTLCPKRAMTVARPRLWIARVLIRRSCVKGRYPSKSYSM